MEFLSGQWSMTELCERYRVSRPTGYKWLHRDNEGLAGLHDRSRAPTRCPHRTPASIENRILRLREQYGWGAKKLIQVLERRQPEVAWPSRSTVKRDPGPSREASKEPTEDTLGPPGGRAADYRKPCPESFRHRAGRPLYRARRDRGRDLVGRVQRRPARSLPRGRTEGLLVRPGSCEPVSRSQ